MKGKRELIIKVIKYFSLLGIVLIIVLKVLRFEKFLVLYRLEYVVFLKEIYSFFVFVEFKF